MNSVTKEYVLHQARQLFHDTSKAENPEYLRALCELIAFSFQDAQSDIQADLEDIESDLLARAEFERGSIGGSVEDWIYV